MKKLLIIVVATLVAGIANANNVAVEFIKLNEGFRDTTYKCVAGKPTIGYGFTSSVYTSKGTMTEVEASVILTNYVNNITHIVNREVKVNLTTNQEAVLIDFIYHYGSGAFKESTLLKYINEGRSTEAICFQLSRWNKARVEGELVVVKGLTNRCNRRITLWTKQ